jgi:hypothetical protein
VALNAEDICNTSSEHKKGLYVQRNWIDDV